MKENKHILMVMPVMKGGGAERVAALLMNEFHKKGYKVEFLLTSSKQEEVIKNELCEEIPLIVLRDQFSQRIALKSIWSKGTRIYSSIFCRMFEKMKKPVPSHFAYVSFMSQYWKEVEALREKMKEDPEMTVIAFLQPSIPMAVLAARGLPNRVIISERGNPERLMKKRYGKNFIEKYYNRVNRVVFQTEDAKKSYPFNIQEKSVIIPNPIKSDLPKSYHGKRKKNITTFCRISLQKNLPMLIEAFSLLHKEYKDYRLKIIGDFFNEEGKKVEEYIKKQIAELDLTDYVEMLPFMTNVHEEILKDAIYVNSSNYEGISNAMLEAMAIGMPVICTDCPIGGARVMIRDGENGLLVPVNGIRELYSAMKTIAENKNISDRLSMNAVKVRETLSIENIVKQWLELI